MQGGSSGQTAVIHASAKQRCPPTWTTFQLLLQPINTHPFKLLSHSPQSRPISIHIPLSSALSMPPMNTHLKNKSTNPGAPDMTPAQRAAAGLPPLKKKAQTKDQQIAALRDELRVAQEMILNVSYSPLCYLFLPCSNARLLIRTTSTNPPRMTNVCKQHWTPVVTRNPGVIPTSLRPHLSVPNARLHRLFTRRQSLSNDLAHQT
jgi:hypothetical protein